MPEYPPLDPDTGEPIRMGRTPGGNNAGIGGGGGGGGGGGFGGGLGMGFAPVGMPGVPMGLRKRVDTPLPGVVPGSPQPQDTVPAMLTPGEIVMNPGVTSNPQMAAALLALNQQGAMRMMNSGSPFKQRLMQAIMQRMGEQGGMVAGMAYGGMAPMGLAMRSGFGGGVTGGTWGPQGTAPMGGGVSGWGSAGQGQRPWGPQGGTPQAGGVSGWGAAAPQAGTARPWGPQGGTPQAVDKTMTPPIMGVAEAAPGMAYGGMVPGYAMGGVVPGTPDYRMAMDRAALLEALMAMGYRLPGMAYGGMVPGYAMGGMAPGVRQMAVPGAQMTPRQMAVPGAQMTPRPMAQPMGRPTGVMGSMNQSSGTPAAGNTPVLSGNVNDSSVINSTGRYSIENTAGSKGKMYWTDANGIVRSRNGDVYSYNPNDQWESFTQNWNPGALGLNARLMGQFGQAGYFDPRGNQMLMDSVRQEALSNARAAQQGAGLRAQLAGLDPGAAASYQLEAGLRGSSDVARALNTARTQSMLQQQQLANSMLGGWQNYASSMENAVQQANLQDRNANNQSQREHANQWAQIGGQFAGAVGGGLAGRL